jgi:hypothetical protein
MSVGGSARAGTGRTVPLELALRHVPDRLACRRLGDVRRGDLQQLVDDLTRRLSGSRVRSVVNALRSL